jgi:hypothetical protein
MKKSGVRGKAGRGKSRLWPRRSAKVALLDQAFLKCRRDSVLFQRLHPR